MNTELLTKIATADSAEALKVIIAESKAEIDGDAVLSATLAGRLLSFASYKGVSIESLVNRAEKNEEEIKSKASAELEKFEVLRKIQVLLESAVTLARTINSKGSILTVYDSTDGISDIVDFLPETVKTAGKHLDKDVKPIRKRKNVNVRLMRKNDKTEGQAVAS